MKSMRIICLAAFTVIIAGYVHADDASSEAALIAVLQSDAPGADKAITCKKLAIEGSSAAVPELAKLLPDPQLSSWARIALEAIPGDEANEALRDAAESLDGVLLVGMINSLGVRRDAEAVDSLKNRLTDADTEVASAAASALGRIGNAEARDALRSALKNGSDVASAVGEGAVLCAEQLLAEGDTAGAIALYDEVRAADVPQQRIVEATRGAILARADDGIPLLLEQLRSDDRTMFRLALSTSREFSGDSLDQVLADELNAANPDRGALIVQAMADRPDNVILPAIVAAAKDGTLPVRLSAIDALARVGDDSCLQVLLDTATEGNEVLEEAAKETLGVLPGDTVDEQIVAQLSDAKGAMYPLLIEVVGDRRIDAMPQLVKALDDDGEVVRHAAIESLGETVPLSGLTVLTSLAISPKHPGDKEAAEKALKTAAIRMPDRDACAGQLISASFNASSATKKTFLEILSEVGGSRALQALSAAAKSGDDDQVNTSTALLGKWNSVEAGPVLLDLSKTLKERKYKVRTLRGFVGLARKFPMDADDRAEMCQNAIDAAIRVEEKKLALDVLNLHAWMGGKEGLEVAVSGARDRELKAYAQKTAIAIAQKMNRNNLIREKVDMKDVLTRIGMDTLKIEIVKAEYVAGDTVKDVTDILKKQVQGLPLIELPAGNYNDSFGGDPSPGSPKQLKIQYKIDGKDGEITLDENAQIFLSIPE